MKGKKGSFLVSREAKITNLIIGLFTWINIVLIIYLACFDPYAVHNPAVLLGILLLLTISVGLSHRESHRVNVQQELEIMATSVEKDKEDVKKVA